MDFLKTSFCFTKQEIAWWEHPTAISSSPWSEHVKAFSQDNNPFSIRHNTSLVTVYKTLFSSSSYAFHTQKWFNRASDVVLRKTPPLVK
jgi:hypothetical protein